MTKVGKSLPFRLVFSLKISIFEAVSSKNQIWRTSTTIDNLPKKRGLVIL